MENKIDITKDKAKDQYYEMQNEKSMTATTISIYTDGSGIKNKIGAATYDATINETKHQHLGKDTQYHVYAAELVAL
jgi:sRNA-binding protein